MSRCPVILACSVLVAAGAAAVSCRPTIALAEPPAPAARAYADSATAESDAQQAKLEEQLEAARKQLEEAAHQVAELSAQLSQPVIESFVDMEGDHGRAIIGVQLEPTPGGAGARVRGVSPGGPAAEAGIRAGDVVVAVNGTEVKGENPARQVMRLMRAVKPDSKVSVRVLREGSPHDFTVVARQSPGYFFANFPPFTEPLVGGPRGPFLVQGPMMDMELATLTPQLGRYFGSETGVLVVRAPADGALKLEDGDVILAIDGRQPTSGSHATRILASYQPGEKVTLRIVRQHKTLDLEATVPERAGHRHVATGESRRPRGAPTPQAAPMPQVAPLPPLAPLPPPPDKVAILRDEA